MGNKKADRQHTDQHKNSPYGDEPYFD